MSKSNLSIVSDGSASFLGERQLSQMKTRTTVLDLSDTPKRQNDAQQSAKSRKPKRKKKLTLSMWSIPVSRSSSARSRRSTASVVSSKGVPVTLFIRKMKKKSDKSEQEAKVKGSKKTIEAIIDSMSPSDSMDSIFSLNSYMNEETENEDHNDDTLSRKAKFLLTFKRLPHLRDVSRALGHADNTLVEKKDTGHYVENIDPTTPNISDESSSELRLYDGLPVKFNDALLTSIHEVALSEESLTTFNEENFADETELLKHDDGIVKFSSTSSTESVSLLQSSSFGSFDRITSIMEIEKEKKEASQLNVIDEMTKMNETMMQSNLPESEILLKQRETTTELVEHFLAQLINDTVQFSEAKDRKYLNMNKTLILQDTMKVIEDFRYEQRLQDILNKRIIEYFYRRNKIQSILPTKSEEIHKTRLQTALTRLDEVLNIYNETFELYRNQKEDLEKKRDTMRLQANNRVMELERVVRDTMNSRPEFQKISIVADDLLKRMTRLRNEVSKKRLQLILKQHAVKDIKEKINKVEYIDEGLSMSTYITTEQQVKSLSKKIRERNVDIRRYANKARTILHMLAHYKTKGVMITEDLKAARKEFATKSASKSELRRRIFELTKEHNKLRQDINEIKQNGTIQQYPLLIDDYDRTVDSNKEKRCIVEDLRIQHGYLIWRIENLEDRFTRKQDLKFPKSVKSRRLSSWRPSKLLSEDMSKAISRALLRYGTNDHKFKEFISSIGIDPISYEIDDNSNDLTTLRSSSQFIASEQA